MGRNFAAIIVAVIVVFAVAGKPGPARAAADTPVVFIPGIFGSLLCEPNGEQVWRKKTLELEWSNRDAVYNEIVALFERLKLAPSTTTDLVPCGVIGKIKDHGFLWDALVWVGIMPKNGYEDILSFLDNLRSDKKETLIFSYDWRQSNFKSADLLKTYLDRLPPGQKVDVVAHSMGGIVARLYLDRYAGDKRIRKLITLGTPHWGAPRQLKLFMDSPIVPEWWSVDLESAFKRSLNFVDPSLAAKVFGAFHSFPSMYELLPSTVACCMEGQGTFNPLDLKLWYGAQFLPGGMRDPGSDAGKSLEQMLAGARQVQKKLKQAISGPRTFLLAATVHGGTETVTLKRGGTNEPHTVLVDDGLGDGTVPYTSAVNNGLNKDDVLASTDPHAEPATTDTSRESLTYALTGDGDRPAVRNKYGLGELLSNLSEYELGVSVAVNFAKIGVSDLWEAGKQQSAFMFIDYTVTFKDEVTPKVLEREGRKFIERVGGALGDRVPQLRFASEANLPFTQSGVTHRALNVKGSSNLVRRGQVVLSFTGRAPDEPGLVRLIADGGAPLVRGVRYFADVLVLPSRDGQR